VSAFVASMYVVVTPLLAALLLRTRPSGPTLVATALTCAGDPTMRYGAGRWASARR
jgi:drug/metabolite transporter (DMT)-like permease